MLAFMLLASSALAVIRLNAADYPVKENGTYQSMEEVAVYLARFEHLPPNYLTKREAQDLGWVASRGNLWQVTDRMSIGGDRFGNYEGQLPEARGRTWKECDIDYVKGNRNAKRICFSNDGLIYYSGSHYRDFVRMY